MYFGCILSINHFSVVKDQEAQTTQELFHRPVPKLTKSANKIPLKKVTSNHELETERVFSDKMRPLEECVRISKQYDGYSLLSDDEIVQVFKLTVCYN